MPRAPFLSFLLFLSIPFPCLAQSSLSDSSFHIDYSSAGITSLKHTNDRYDTDYIAAQRALGDLLIRYRATGEKDWQQASGAVLDSGSARDQSSASFTIGTLVPTLASLSKISASVRSPAVQALNGDLVPKNSQDEEVPRYFWYGRDGTSEWVQYDFPAPKEVRSVQVYWATHEEERNPGKLPLSWRLLYRDGENWKEVSPSRDYPISANQFNDLEFAPVTTAALRIEVQLQKGGTAGLYRWNINRDGRNVTPIKDLLASETFRLKDSVLSWTISLKNATTHELEIGDLALPLPFNTQYVWDKTETYTKRLIPHFLVAGNGSFLYWMRTNTEGPYLVMTPASGCGLEYFQPRGFGNGVAYYIHSAAAEEELKAKGGSWRLPPTRSILKPGASETCEFRFRWAADYNTVRQVLYEEGQFDINVVPGMTVPTDLPATFALRTRNKNLTVVPEFFEQTKIESLGEHGKDTYLYRVSFTKLGENLLKVRYGKGQYLSLEFFVTEPLESLFKKRASFLVSHEQVRDPSKWYNSVFSQWDMKNHVLRTPDDLDGLSYAIASDDPALGKAPFIAGKNIAYPNQPEIAAVENYLRNFVWGGLQQTDKEPYPYAIYGIPNWKVNRDSPKDDPGGKKHIWRIYDYPHIILLYYNMYEVAKLYPSMTKYLDKNGYLERAFGTAKAFFTVPMEIVKWSPYETGTYNELVIPALIDALYENGRKEQADWLRSEWEKKVKYFVNDHPYLFGSEYPFDSTGFESTHAFAKYALAALSSTATGTASDDFRRTVKLSDATTFLEDQIKLNIACRGWLETAYYYLGSDYRGSGPSSYTLSYMAQMGGWAIEDYGLHYAQDPAAYLRLGYASYLSSWALLNTGTPDSSYGYWFPGKENDGGASGGFEPRPWGRAWLGNKEMGRGSWWYSGEIDLGFSGALRTAATVVSEDPIFGLISYGGDLQREKDAIRVVPKDGLRMRFHIIRGAQRIHMLLDRDGFAKDKAVTFENDGSAIAFELENRGGGEHETTLWISGLTAGRYEVKSGGKVQEFSVREGEERPVTVAVPPAGTNVAIQRK